MTRSWLLVVTCLLGACAAPDTALVACPAKGCAALDPPSPRQRALLEHAEGDLECARSTLEVTAIDDTTAEVRGCGRAARYAWIVTRMQERWLLDSPVTVVRPPM